MWDPPSGYVGITGIGRECDISGTITVSHRGIAAIVTGHEPGWRVTATSIWASVGLPAAARASRGSMP